MKIIKNHSIDLIFTSPPYWDLKDYSNNGQIGYKQAYEDYLNDMLIVFKECYRVVKDDGIICININSRVSNNKYYPIHIDFYKQLKDIGFKYFDNIVWHKASGIPAPSNKFSDRFEYIIIASRSPIIINSDNSNEYLNEDLKHIKSWHIKKKAGSLLSTQPHPAYFPIGLAEKAIKTFTNDGDCVLDPFLGIGSTLIASLNLHRSCFGFEINNDYINTIKNTVSKELLDKIQFIK